MSAAAGKRGVAIAFMAVVSVLAVTAPPSSASTLATLELGVDRADPGEEVSFSGWYYNDVHPVMIRWGAVDGPVLATVTPDTFGVVHNHFRSIAGSLRIPADARPGRHLLVATQDFAPPGKITWGVPARTEIQVGQGSAPPDRSASPPVSRLRSVAVDAGPGTAALLAAAGVGAAAASVLVGLTVVVVRKRRA